MAIILSAFIGLGLQPGITMVTTRVDLTFSMVWTIVVANLIATGGLLAIAPYLARVTLIRAPVLASIIIVFSILGAYMENRELGDIIALAVFSLVGWAMKETGWPRPPLLLGFVLSLVLERYLFISLNTFGWSWVTRPGVLSVRRDRRQLGLHVPAGAGHRERSQEACSNDKSSRTGFVRSRVAWPLAA